MASSSMPVPTGYSTADTFFATRFKQGGRVVYSLDLSPLQLTSLIQRPDPEVPVETNRAIRKAHARQFATYFREHEEWVIPSILLRTARKFKFEVQTEIAGTEFGILEVPRTAAREISILDGQHRTLGFFLAAEGIAADLEEARAKLQAAQRQFPDTKAPADARAEIERLNAQAKRLEMERLSVLVYVEAEMAAYRQMFFDISDNALGITASVRSRFDSRKVLNRALPEILDHPLLRGRTEGDADRLRRNSEDFLTVKNVADITKNTVVGFTGRIGRRQEKLLTERFIADRAKEFFDLLVRAFGPLQAVQLEQASPLTLRERSLLGSPAFLRMLAGVYWEMTSSEARGRSVSDVYDFFKRLEPHVTSADGGNPVYSGSVWLEHMPQGSFTPGYITPNTMRQQFTATHDKLVEWAISPKLSPFLDEPPAPRPIEDPLENPDAPALTLEQAKALEK